MKIDDIGKRLLFHSGQSNEAGAGLAQKMSPWKCEVPWDDYQEVLACLRDLKPLLRDRDCVPKAIARSIAVIASSIVEGVLREDSIARTNNYISSEQIHCFMDWLDDILALYHLCLADVDDTHFDEIYRIALQRKMG